MTPNLEATIEQRAPYKTFTSRLVFSIRKLSFFTGVGLWSAICCTLTPSALAHSPSPPAPAKSTPGEAIGAKAVVKKQIPAHSSKLITRSKVIRFESFGETEQVKTLGQRIALEQDLPSEWVIKQIASAHLIPGALQQMQPAPQTSKKNWTWRAVLGKKCFNPCPSRA